MLQELSGNDKGHPMDEQLASVSEQTTRLLISSGWEPSRRVDTSRWEIVVAEEGWHVVPAAVGMMSQLGGLRLAARGPNGRAWLLDPAWAVRRIYSAGWVAEYEARAAEQVTPIGAMDPGPMTLLMGESGALYGVFDDVLVQFGDSPASALDALLSGDPPRDVG